MFEFPLGICFKNVESLTPTSDSLNQNHWRGGGCQEFIFLESSICDSDVY